MNLGYFSSDSRASERTNSVYNGDMSTSKQIRRSITLPSQIAQQVSRIAKKKRLSDNRVLVELLERGLEAEREREKKFFVLAERFRTASDPREIKQLGDEMGRFIFGE